MLASNPDHPSWHHLSFVNAGIRGVWCSASDPSSWFTSLKRKKPFNFPRVCVPLCVCWYTQWPEKGIGSLELELQVDVSCWTFTLGTKFRSCKSRKHSSLLSHIYLTMQNRISDSGAHRWPLLSPPLTFSTLCCPKGFTVLLQSFHRFRS